MTTLQFSVGLEVRVRVLKGSVFTCRGIIALLNDDNTCEIVFDESSKSSGAKAKSLRYKYKFVDPSTGIVSYFPQKEGVYHKSDISLLSSAELAIAETVSSIVDQIHYYKSLGNVLYALNDFIGAMEYYEQGSALFDKLGYNDQKEYRNNSHRLFTTGSPVMLRQQVGKCGDYEYRNGMISDVILDKSLKTLGRYEIMLSAPVIPKQSSASHDDDSDDGSDCDAEEEDEMILVSMTDDLTLFPIVTARHVKKYDEQNKLNDITSAATNTIVSGVELTDIELFDLQRAYYLNISKCLWNLNGYVGWACHYANLAVCVTLYKYEEYPHLRYNPSSTSSTNCGNTGNYSVEYEKQVSDVYYLKCKTLLAGHRGGLAKRSIIILSKLFHHNYKTISLTQTNASSSKKPTYCIAKIATALSEIDSFNNKKRKENKQLAKHIANWVGTAMDISSKVKPVDVEKEPDSNTSISSGHVVSQKKSSDRSVAHTNPSASTAGVGSVSTNADNADSDSEDYYNPLLW